MTVDVNPVISGLPAARGMLVLGLFASNPDASVTGTTSETTLWSVAIPVGLMGPYSRLIIEPDWLYTNSANNKVLAVKIGPSLASAASVYSRTRTTTVGEVPLIAVQGRGGLAVQKNVYAAAGDHAVGQASGSTNLTIDFSVLNYIYVTGTLANTGESIALNSCAAYILAPGLGSSGGSP